MPANEGSGSHLKYRADVDGLRAIAVLAVLFFHADLGCHGGYVGVDVFFVISGYLITGLILKNLTAGRFQIVEFWERRARRILPALAVVAAASLAAGWFLLLPLDFQELGQSVIALTMLVSNVYFWKESGYFAQAAEVKPLLHTWSLAVEEQFYLLFPFLLVALRRFSPKALLPAILLLGGASFGLSVWWSYLLPTENFYLLPTRAWELLLGAFFAAVPARRAGPRWVGETLGGAGLLAIMLAVFFYTRDTRFPGLAALLPCAGAGLVIWSGGRTTVGKFLATRPIVFVGLISYSLYLWHWPLLVFAKFTTTVPLTPGQRILLLLASMVFAAASWRFVETRIRQRTILQSRFRIFAFAATSTALLLLAGLALHKSQGVPARLPAEALSYAHGAADRAFQKSTSLSAAQKEDFVELGAGDRQQPVTLFVWGDSHGMAVMPVLDVLCKEHAVRGVAAANLATAPLAGYASEGEFSLGGDSLAFGKTVIEFIRKKHVRHLLIVARWDYYLDKDKEPARLRRGLLDTLNALRDSGTKIWIMRQVPRHRWGVPEHLARAVWHGRKADDLGLPLPEYRREYQRQEPLFTGLSATYPKVTILDPTELFVTSSGLCRAAQNGRALYYDSGHLSVTGAMLLRPLFAPIFAGPDAALQPEQSGAR